MSVAAANFLISAALSLRSLISRRPQALPIRYFKTPATLSKRFISSNSAKRPIRQDGKQAAFPTNTNEELAAHKVLNKAVVDKPAADIPAAHKVVVFEAVGHKAVEPAVLARKVVESPQRSPLLVSEVYK